MSFKTVKHPVNGRMYCVPTTDEHTMRLLGVLDHGTGYRWQALIANTFRDSFYQHSDLQGCAIDAGAHIGMNTIEYSDLFKHVYAFEPVPSVFNALQNTIQSNMCNNVTAHNMALGQFDSTTTMCYDETNTLATHKKNTKNRRGHSVEVQVAKLDSVIPEDADIRFLKIDCEGMELSVLRGAQQILQRCAPVVQFEYKPNLMRKDQAYDLEIFDYLTLQGYTIVNKFARQVDHNSIQDHRVNIVPMHKDLQAGTAPTYCDFFAVKHRQCRYKGGRFVWQ